MVPAILELTTIELAAQIMCARKLELFSAYQNTENIFTQHDIPHIDSRIHHSITFWNLCLRLDTCVPHAALRTSIEHVSNLAGWR